MQGLVFFLCVLLVILIKFILLYITLKLCNFFLLTIGIQPVARGRICKLRTYSKTCLKRNNITTIFFPVTRGFPFIQVLEV